MTRLSKAVTMPPVTDNPADLARRFEAATPEGKGALVDSVFTTVGARKGNDLLRRAGVHGRLYRYDQDPPHYSPFLRNRVYEPYVSEFARNAMGGTTADFNWNEYHNRMGWAVLGDEYLNQMGRVDLTDPKNAQMRPKGWERLEKLPYYDQWVALRNKYRENASPKMRVILDLPIIVTAIGAREGANIPEGWFTSAEQIMKWMVAEANLDRNQAAPLMLSWDIVLATERGREKYQEMRDPAYLFRRNQKGVHSAAVILNTLRADDSFTFKPGATFDYTREYLRDPQAWHSRHFQNNRYTWWEMAQDLAWPCSDVKFAGNGELAALGRYTMYAVPKGRISDDGKQLIITGVGLFIRDSFDFEDDQIGGLGNWDPVNFLFHSLRTGTLNIHLSNADFREFRKLTGHGGDYYVFTDMDVVEFDTPQVFNITTIDNLDHPDLRYHVPGW
jgi:hypothetical protein